MNNNIIIADTRIINLDEIIFKYFDKSMPITSTLLPRPSTKFFPNIFEKINFYLNSISADETGKIIILIESELWLNLDVANQILCESVNQINQYLKQNNFNNIVVEPWVIYARTATRFRCYQDQVVNQNQA